MDPGYTYNCSNTGYLILSAVVETVTNQSYFGHVVQNIANDVELWHTNASSHVNATLIQESENVGPSVISPGLDFWVADIYSGDDICKETAVGT